MYVVSNEIYSQFKKTVDQYLIRHQSILDILSKSQETNALIGRATIKAVTQCGCIKINAEKPEFPEETSLGDLKNILNSQVEGQLCEQCREIIEKEIGKNLFYLTALCNTLDLDLDHILKKENDKVQTLRVFNLT